MKIKYNNFLIIVPIFLLIALVMSYLNYTNEVKEIKWGIETKAKSISIPSRIFIEYMLQEKNFSDVLVDVKPKFENILKYNLAQRFYISVNQKVILDTDDEKSTDSFTIPDNLDKSILSDVFIKNNLHLITIHTPINGTKPNTILSIEVDNTDFFKRIDDAFNEIIFTVIFAFILGVVTSYLLSRIVTTKIFALNTHAKAIASGNYSHNSYMGSIHEFTDLGDTLNIVKSIMKEIVFKTKNIIVEEEKFRSDEDLVNTYNQVLFDSKKSSLNGVDIFVNFIGYPQAGFFFDSLSDSGKLYAYIAKIENEQASIDTLIKANAAQRYISSKIQKNSLDLSKLVNLFNINYLKFIYIDEDYMLHSYEISNGVEKKSVINLEDGSVHLICEENSSIEKILQVYIQNYKELSIEDISNDVPNIFSDGVNEIFILAQKNVAQ